MTKQNGIQHLFFCVFKSPAHEVSSCERRLSYVFYADDDAGAKEIALALHTEGEHELGALYRLTKSRRMMLVALSGCRDESGNLRPSSITLSDDDKADAELLLVGGTKSIDVKNIPFTRIRPDTPDRIPRTVMP